MNWSKKGIYHFVNIVLILQYDLFTFAINHF
jgi:hypothetical protein